MSVDLISPQSGRRTSYSAFKLWQACGRQYQLEKLEGKSGPPSWALIGGSAHHAQTEFYDLEGGFDPEHHDYEDDFASFMALEIAERLTRHPEYPTDTWKCTGKPNAKDWPNREDSSWWLHFGPSFAEGWSDWQRDSGWSIAKLPSGELAVETKMTVDIGPVRVLMYMDRLMVHKEMQAMAVVDLKAGTRKPESSLQLGVYATGVEMVYGFRPLYGAYYMSRKKEPAGLIDLSRWTQDYFAREFAMFDMALEHEVFTHRAEDDGYCKNMCNVSSHCEVGNR